MRLPILSDFLGPRMEPLEPGSDVLDRMGPAPAAIGPDRLPALRRGEVALMFSGGLDSTAAALALADRYERVHLLTYRNGYGHYYHHRTSRRAADLAREASCRFTWTLIESRRWFDRIVVDTLREDWLAHRSGFVWCMGCKLAMHARSAAWCLENGILEMSDGSSSDTDEMVEQSLLSLSLIRFFYEDLDVDFGTPVYEAGRDAKREALSRKGMRLGAQVMGRHLAVQPTCLAGELYYTPYLLFNKPVAHDEAEVARFIDGKQRIARELVAGHFEARGIRLDDLLVDRRRRRAETGLPVPGAGS